MKLTPDEVAAQKETAMRKDIGRTLRGMEGALPRTASMCSSAFGFGVVQARYDNMSIRIPLAAGIGMHAFALHKGQQFARHVGDGALACVAVTIGRRVGRRFV